MSKEFNPEGQNDLPQVKSKKTTAKKGNPKYAIEIYEPEKAFEPSEKLINRMQNQEKKKEVSELFKQMRCFLEEPIIKKHIKKKNAKIIVFCRNRPEFKFAESKTGEWFGEINPNIHTYQIYIGSKMNENGRHTDSNIKQLQAFNDDVSPALKLLYCVGLSSEDIHIKTADGVVMLHTTIPIPVNYKQQIDLAVKISNQTDSPIFDLVRSPHALMRAYEFIKKCQEEEDATQAKKIELADTVTQFLDLSYRLTDAYAKPPVTIEEKVDAVVADLEIKRAYQQ